MRPTRLRSVRLLASASLVAAIAAATAGCQTTQTSPTTAALPLAAPVNQPDAAWQHDVAVYAPQYRADPTKIDVALHYAQALRATGQRAQAVAVLERLSMENPNNKVVLGEYGRALAEAGDYNHALDVLGRARNCDIALHPRSLESQPDVESVVIPAGGLTLDAGADVEILQTIFFARINRHAAAHFNH